MNPGDTNLDTPEFIRTGDVVRLRKAHPCGGHEWRVWRVGDDMGIDCTTCGRRVLLPVPEFARRRVAPKPADTPATDKEETHPQPLLLPERREKEIP